MKKHVQHEKPPRSADAQAWIDEETEAQQHRYQAIFDEMKSIQPERTKWVAQFLKNIQTRGFSVTGDVLRQISKEETPERPNRDDADRVVW